MTNRVVDFPLPCCFFDSDDGGGIVPLFELLDGVQCALGLAVPEGEGGIGVVCDLVIAFEGAARPYFSYWGRNTVSLMPWASAYSAAVVSMPFAPPDTILVTSVGISPQGFQLTRFVNR